MRKFIGKAPGLIAEARLIPPVMLALAVVLAAGKIMKGLFSPAMDTISQTFSRSGAKVPSPAGKPVAPLVGAACQNSMSTTDPPEEETLNGLAEPAGLAASQASPVPATQAGGSATDPADPPSQDNTPNTTPASSNETMPSNQVKPGDLAALPSGESGSEDDSQLPAPLPCMNTGIPSSLPSLPSAVCGSSGTLPGNPQVSAPAPPTPAILTSTATVSQLPADEPDGYLKIDLPDTDGRLVFTGSSSVPSRAGVFSSRLLYAPPLLLKRPGTSSGSALPDFNGLDVYGNAADRLKYMSAAQFKYLSEHRAIMLNDPEGHFIRKGKITADETLRSLVAIGMRSLRETCKDGVNSVNQPEGPFSLEEQLNEIVNLNELGQSREISGSAFRMNLDKISDAAVGHLFAVSAGLLHGKPVFKGREVGVVDGMSITFRNGRAVVDTEMHMNTGGKQGHNLVHLVSLLFLGERGYKDYVLKKMRKSNERTAFCELLDRNPGFDGVFALDRGFPSYDTTFLLSAYCDKYGASYVMRVSEDKGMINTLWPNPPRDEDGNLMEGEKTVTLTLARTHRKEYFDRFHSDDGTRVFVPIDKDTTFTAIPVDDDKSFVQYKVRIAIIKIGDHFEVLLTNTDYTLDELKELYALRWICEVTHKVIKSEVGLNYLHFLRGDRLAKEICARMYAFNLAATVVFDDTILALVNTNAKTDAPLKYEYRTNYNSVIGDLRPYIFGWIPAKTLFERAVRYKSPVRPGRIAPRANVNSTPVCVSAPYN